MLLVFVLLILLTVRAVPLPLLARVPSLSSEFDAGRLDHCLLSLEMEGSIGAVDLQSLLAFIQLAADWVVIFLVRVSCGCRAVLDLSLLTIPGCS